MVESDLEGAFERCALFRAIDPGRRGDLVAKASRRSFKAGDQIFRLGDPGDSMMAILRGSVRISLLVPSGHEVVLADLDSGEVVGEVSLLDGGERSASANALTNCELLVLSRKDAMTFLQDHPQTCIKLLELLCARLRRSDERMTDMAFAELPERLAKAILRRASAPGGKDGSMRLALTQNDLAKMIGGTRENVNRHLRDWQKRGILDRKAGWIVLLDPDSLREIARMN